MKTIFIHLGRILLGTILLLLIWMISMSIAEYFIPSHLQVSEAPEGLLFSRFLLVCLIHVILLYVTIRLSVWSGVRLMLTVFLLIFMIQYFLSMIEAVWFNESLNMPVSGISSLLLSGFLLSLFFTPLMVWIGGKIGKPGKPEKPGMLHVEKNQQNIPRTDFFDRDLI
ncbi:MAG: hypothetical protein KFF73_02815, partial [Cyclobacteriaceae bacterium]|nr:hypothetical protein [Cyclobacteriaceae bacterium]